MNQKNKTKKIKQNSCSKFTIKHTAFEKKFEKSIEKNLYDTEYHPQTEVIELLRHVNDKKNSKITPHNDFYSFVNERWIQREHLTKKQLYITQIDDFRIIQDKVYDEISKIIDNYTSSNNSQISNELHNLHTSLQHLNSDAELRKYGIEFSNKIDAFRQNKKNLWKLLGNLNQNEIISWGLPLHWSLVQDEKNPTIYSCHIALPQLTLLDFEIYYDDGTNVKYKENYRKEYNKYLSQLFQLVYGKSHQYDIQSIFDIEMKLFNAMGCNKLIEDKQHYNKISHVESVKKYNFDWIEFSKNLGFKVPPSYFVTNNVNYLKCCSDLLLDEWNNEKWKTYWVYIYIRQMTRWNATGHKIFFNFHGKFVRGQSKDYGNHPIFVICYAFNTLISNEYILLNKNDEYVNYVKTMVEDLKHVFMRIIHRNKWLHPKTKKYALIKLKNLKLIVGSPKVLRKDPLLLFSKSNPWENIVKIINWRQKQFIKLEGQGIIDIPIIDWSESPFKFIGNQSFIVNASYTPSTNSMYIPSGYIQNPFINLDERGIEYNLARIGFTVAHELSHSLDDWGSKYDSNGKLHDWWDKTDKVSFKKIQDDIIKQYEAFAKRDGIIFDASIGIGEDLADIAGLDICLEYLTDFQKHNHQFLPARLLSYKLFFISYAQQMRQIIPTKSLTTQLKINPHPLNKYRTNIPLSRMPLFRVIYDITKNDDMFWPSINRIWNNLII